MEENTMRFNPVEIQPGSIAFSVVPGSSVTVPFRIINHTGVDDYFEISVRGIPSTWVSLEIPVIHMADGEQRETRLVIHPPAGMAGSTGATRMVIRVASQANPIQGGEAVIELHMGYDPGAVTKGANPLADPLNPTYPAGGSTFGTLPYEEDSRQAGFDSDLSPRRVDAGSTARLRIYNLRSTPETFTVSWHDQNNDLEFVSSQTGPVRVMPGEVVAIDFAASPRSPNWLGSPQPLPYSAVVRDSSGEAQAHNGEVTSRALIPVWVLPAFLVFCLTSLCGVGLLWNWNQSRLVAATQTADAFQVGLLDSAATTATAIFEQTLTAVSDPALDPTNIWATVTALAEEALLTGTPTPEPTDTLLPEETPTPTLEDTPVIIPSPTFTFTITPEPTLTFTPTWTPTPPPATETPANPTPTATRVVLPVTGFGSFAFVSDRGGSLQLYTINSAGEITPLIEGLGPVHHPAWSPDGARIAFTVENEAGSDIYVMNRDGSDPVNLTGSPSNDREPTWSPDGNFIAFTTDRDGNDEIYIMPADGSEVVNLTDSPSNDRQPVWFDDAEGEDSQGSILFSSDRDGNNEIYRIDLNSGDLANLTNHPGSDTAPDVLPEGGLVLFVSDRDGNLDIFRMALNGDDLQNLTNHPAEDNNPAWSPEGGLLSFASNRGDNFDIFVLDLEAGEPENITQSPARDLYPAWR